MKEIISLLIIYFLSEIGAWDKNKAGPYDILFERLEPCQGYENDIYRYTYKLKKFNRTTVAVDVAVQLVVPFDNNMKMSLIIDQFANNGWKENYYTKEFDGSTCTVMKSLAPDLSAELFEVAKVKDCPVPAGNYSVKNWPLFIEFKSVPVFFYNKYRYKFVLEKDNKRLICFYGYVDVVPKRIRKG